MTVDVFGRKLNTSGVGAPGKPGVGFQTTPDGHYNLDCKRLCNVGEAKHPGDAVTLDVLTLRIDSLTEHINHLFSEERKANTLTIEQRIKANLINIRVDLDAMKRTIADIKISTRVLQDLAWNATRRMK